MPDRTHRRPAALPLALALPLAAAPGAAAEGGHYLITARQAYLVGGEGDTGDSFRYDGSAIWTGPGIATIDVNDRRNDGVVIGTVHTHGHVYTIVLDRFAPGRPPGWTGASPPAWTCTAPPGTARPCCPRATPT